MLEGKKMITQEDLEVLAAEFIQPPFVMQDDRK